MAPQPSAAAAPAPDPSVVNAIHAQIDELQSPTLDKLARMQQVLQTRRHLESVIGGAPANPPNALLTKIVKQVDAIANQVDGPEILGIVLADLAYFNAILPDAVATQTRDIVQAIEADIRQFLSYRPDVRSVMNDLEALRHLRGGPADAKAFHDFYVLQIAFKNVWKHAFDKNVQGLVEQLYLEHMKLYDDAGLQLPPFGAIHDINDLEKFLGITPTSINAPEDLMAPNPAYTASASGVLSAMNPLLTISNTSLANAVPQFIPSVDLALTIRLASRATSSSIR